jgi:hypothetical protein
MVIDQGELSELRAVHNGTLDPIDEACEAKQWWCERIRIQRNGGVYGFAGDLP